MLVLFSSSRTTASRKKIWKTHLENPLTFFLFEVARSYFQTLRACSWNARIRGLSYSGGGLWGYPPLPSIGIKLLKMIFIYFVDSDWMNISLVWGRWGYSQRSPHEYERPRIRAFQEQARNICKYNMNAQLLKLVRFHVTTWLED